MKRRIFSLISLSLLLFTLIGLPVEARCKKKSLPRKVVGGIVKIIFRR